MRSSLGLWLMLFVVFSAIFAAVPYAGYYVRGGQDQWIFLVLFGCWLLAGWAVLLAGILAWWLRKRSPLITPLFILLALALLIAVLGGFGGVRYAFLELIAG